MDHYPLVETPDLLLAALERSNDAVVIVDGDLHVGYFNAAAELIWGLDRAEVLGRHASCLGRWHDAVLGEVSPAKFIPLAEECGLIEQIGQWSIREACRQMAEWRDDGLDIPCVSVNLSPINFQNPNLASMVARILADHGLPPEVLGLEITEGVILNERSVAIATMDTLRKLGVGCRWTISESAIRASAGWRICRSAS